MERLMNIMGGKGFIGSNYAKLYPECLVLDRNDYVPKPMSDILYFISTVDNYNVFIDPHLDINTNLNTLITVLENWKNNYPLGVFNFISSWFVYGNVELPATENAPCNPQGFYSITKRAAEQLLISYCKTFNLKYRILRLPGVLGKSDMKVSKKKNALQFLINEMKENRPIELYDNGQFYRDYMHVEDCCRAISLIINKSPINDIYNVCSTEPYLFRNLIDMARDQLQSKSEIITIPEKQFHVQVQVKNMHMDPTKLFQLGYYSKYNMYDTIAELIA